MSSNTITLVGTLATIRPEDTERLNVYIVCGHQILARTNVDANGNVRFNLSQEAIAAKTAYGLELVIGPAGLDTQLDQVPQLQRFPLDLKQRVEGSTEIRLPLERVQINEKILTLWWRWCRKYCVSGSVIGPRGCPVPGAQVTVYGVTHTGGGGLIQTPVATVPTDATGHFTACFNWCTSRFCWPCRPFWWLCWPWWWERDILYVLDAIERKVAQPQLNAQFSVPIDADRLPLSRPEGRSLIRGQGFITAETLQSEFGPDAARTALIRRKLANPDIRALFPWRWWCCDDPNLIFKVTQGGTVIVNEDPAIDTRWCLEDDSTVTLVGNDQTISTCPNDPKPVKGFVWTRVGDTTVDTIHAGYADGSAGSDSSDLAFAGTLDIYGEFAPASGVAYYQVNAGQWGGNPARGGTAPFSSAPIAADLHNTVVILHTDLTVTYATVKMGPFNNAGLTNLYATQEQRPSVPAGLLPPFPTVNPGDAVLWGFNGRKVDANASALVGAGGVGGVDLTITGHNSSFAPVVLPSNPADKLTLMVDNTGLTAAQIVDLKAFRADNTPVVSIGTTGACPAYNIGPGGYVKLTVMVADANGHLFEYEVTPDFGSGSTGTTTPGLRGYRQPGPFPPGPYQAPNPALKSFGGGTEDITFFPTVDCCYDFRLLAGKRVTNGTFFPTLYTADFQTATLKVTV